MCLVFRVILVLLQFTFGFSSVIQLFPNKTVGSADQNLLGIYKRDAAVYRIINGTEANTGQFPGEISLRLTNPEKHICGGSILSKQWVLTAAHCVVIDGYKRHVKEVVVVAGELYIRALSVVKQKRDVSRIVVHPDYYADMARGVGNDIALLQLSDPLEFNSKVRPRRLAEEPVKKGTICRIAGWGVEKPKANQASNRLLYIELPLLDIQKCKNWLSHSVHNIPNGTLCAGYEEGMKDACQGDSGGGLMCNDRLTGVVSWGRGCANPRSPGFYSDVLYFSGWIKRNAIDQRTLRSGFSDLKFSYVWLLVLPILLCG